MLETPPSSSTAAQPGMPTWGQAYLTLSQFYFKLHPVLACQIDVQQQRWLFNGVFTTVILQIHFNRLQTLQPPLNTQLIGPVSFLWWTYGGYRWGFYQRWESKEHKEKLWRRRELVCYRYSDWLKWARDKRRLNRQFVQSPALSCGAFSRWLCSTVRQFFSTVMISFFQTVKTNRQQDRWFPHDQTVVLCHASDDEVDVTWHEGLNESLKLWHVGSINH